MLELELQQSPGVIDVAECMSVKILQSNCVYFCFIQIKIVFLYF